MRSIVNCTVRKLLLKISGRARRINSRTLPGSASDEAGAGTRGDSDMSILPWQGAIEATAQTAAFNDSEVRTLSYEAPRPGKVRFAFDFDQLPSVNASTAYAAATSRMNLPSIASSASVLSGLRTEFR